ncbi:hypothetical protein [Amycolatopsis sp. NPDC004169]|uniref:hypothetical protein n=1 Tax=Amycolatopsis sp. NPDC004169 TaxID=3154453 RepID=UPI0033A4D204
MAADLLVNYLGFPEQEVAQPGAEELRKMLLSLGRPLGRMVFFALLIGKFPASGLAVEFRDQLEGDLAELDRSDGPQDLTELRQGRESRKGQAVTGTDDALIREGDQDVRDAAIPTELTESTVTESETRMSKFRDRTGRTAGDLRLAADRAESGLPLAPDLRAKIESYTEERAALLEAVREFAAAAEDAGIDYFHEVTGAARATLDEQRLAGESADKVARLDRQIAELEKMMELSATGTRARLLRVLEEVRTERDQLTGAAEPVDTEDAPAVPMPDEPDVPDAVDWDEHPTAGAVANTIADAVPGAGNPGAEAARAEAEAADSAPSSIEPEPEPSDAEEFKNGFPWDEGERPLAVQLVSAGRVAEAYWVTALSAEPEIRAAVLRVASASYTVHGSADANAVLAAIDLDPRPLSKDHDAAVLATTAMLRAGLAAGWSHRLLGQLAVEQGLPPRWATLIRSCVAALQSRYPFDSRAGIPDVGQDSSAARWELGRRAAALLKELPRHKTSYQRATRVLQRMMVPGQPLANGLDAVVAWAAGNDDGALASACEELAAPSSPDVLIEKADQEMRTPKQSKEPIVAMALRALVRAVNDVRTVVLEAGALDSRLSAAGADTGPAAADLADALSGITDAVPPPGMAGAALVLFRSWLQNPGSVITSAEFAGPPVVGIPDGIAEPTADVLLSLTDLRYDESGRPDRTDPRTPAILARACEPVNVVEVVRKYCERGDLRRARRVVELTDRGVWPGAGTISGLDKVIAEAADKWTSMHRREVTRARDLFARVRTQKVLEPPEENVVARQLEAMMMPQEPQFDLASAELRDLVDTLKRRLQDRVDELRAELDALKAPKADHDSIVALLTDGDTVTATDFLWLLKTGARLPEPERPTAGDLETFTGILQRGAGRGLTTVRAWADLIGDGRPLAEIGEAGTKAWDGLSDASRHAGNQLASAIKSILRTLGLRCEAPLTEIKYRGARGFRRFTVRGVPGDGSYVSALGSAAAEYTVTVVMEERRGGRSVLDVLGQEEVGRANIVLYLFTMDLRTRRSLAAQATRSRAQAIVIDPAVLGWVAATEPGSWRATQRVTLPWTAFNPYRPFVAGLVPPEVFVGRDREISEVVDSEGGLFLYGGRQLGKSALLRRVEAAYRDDFRLAVYLDLKGRGIGEGEPAGRIWRELVVELKERNVLDAKISDDAPPDVVVTQIRRWIGGHPSRKLLLLADEADAFLTADSRGVPTAGGEARFRHVVRLKELMESTQRRFKVVFAGLHQVRRFGHLPNVPLTHGGPDILIGPLEPRDASRLVTEPMRALGYSFERPELVWRLLSVTNYQAGLIQIFCEELVRTMHARREQARASSIPVEVTEDVVEAVASGKRVRKQIEERLRITINLDDRYRVLMLVIALLSLKDSFGADYGPEEILEQARERWPAGFGKLDGRQVSINLSEMVDLGLLIKLSEDRYAVRSPNVVTMLGTAADLDRELKDADFDLPYEYNPMEARRLLFSSHGRERRSPLTDGQLVQLTATNGVTVVTGTEALGIARVPDAVSRHAEPRGSKVEVHHTAAEVGKAISTAARRTRPTVLIADLLQATEAEIEMVAHKLAKAPLSAVVLVAPAQADFAAELLRSPWVRPDRWTADSVRSWPECPFDVLSSRADLIRATGGWPELVEEVMAMVVTLGLTKQQALEQIRQFFDDREKAAIQLAAAGLDRKLIDLIGPWSEYFEPGEPISPADAAAALELDLPDSSDLLKRLADLGVLDETGEGVVLDVVVHRCLQAVRGES